MEVLADREADGGHGVDNYEDHEEVKQELGVVGQGCGKARMSVDEREDGGYEPHLLSVLGLLGWMRLRMFSRYWVRGVGGVGVVALDSRTDIAVGVAAALFVDTSDSILMRTTHDFSTPRCVDGAEM